MRKLKYKKCKYCNRYKKIDKFAVANIINGKVYRRLKCDSCRNIDKFKLRLKNRKRVEEFKKQSSCFICGNRDYRILQFHHINPKTKLINISDASSFYSEKRIFKEIKKCKMICANCHIVLHYKKK